MYGALFTVEDIFVGFLCNEISRVNPDWKSVQQNSILSFDQKIEIIRIRDIKRRPLREIASLFKVSVQTIRRALAIPARIFFLLFSYSYAI
ncbi:MAG: hypothetical protein OXC62_00780 [Aestuariivita sp.]|nr:hypothetical protein [Aestuariivita sp.]